MSVGPSVSLCVHGKGSTKTPVFKIANKRKGKKMFRGIFTVRVMVEL